MLIGTDQSFASNHRHQRRVIATPTRWRITKHQTLRFAPVGARVDADPNRWMRTKERTIKPLEVAVKKTPLCTVVPSTRALGLTKLRLALSLT